jgi:hypothetical protein
LVVYDISILSNIPLSVVDVLDPSASAQRLRPLFNIGVHDIPLLLEGQGPQPKSNGTSRTDDDDTAVEDESSGWIACTTDSILAMKEDLWDVLITMPAAHSSQAKEKVWPTVEYGRSQPIKATQRDLRRFRSLQSGLAHLSDPQPSPTTPRSQAATTTRPRSMSSATTAAAALLPPTDTERSKLVHETEAIVEPFTWAALAYSGFMWWASAGEQRRAEEGNEHVQDAALLANLAPPSMERPGRRASAAAGLGLGDSIASLSAVRRPEGNDEHDAETEENGGDDGGARTGQKEEAHTELAIITYFHRLTTQMLSVLADVVESSDEDDLLDIDTAAVDSGGNSPDGEDEALLQRGDSDLSVGPPYVRVSSEVLEAMGLDVWSQADAAFVRELTLRYFARRAWVEGKGIEVCGLRVC